MNSRDFLTEKAIAAPIIKRLAMAALCLLAFHVGEFWVGRGIGGLTGGFPKNVLLLKHVLLFRPFGMAIVSVILIEILVKSGYLKPLSLSVSLVAMKAGILIGLGSAVLTVFYLLMLGGQPQFQLAWQSILGNVFSNFYEELFYRGFMVPIALLALGSPAFAIMLSAGTFAWYHADYPLSLQAAVAAVGMVMAYGYFRTRSLVTPWLIHQIVDTVVDAVVKI